MPKYFLVLLFTVSAALGLRAPAALAHAAHCEDTDLGASMAEMKRPYKALRKAVRAGDAAQVRALATQLREMSERAIDQTPILVREGKAEMPAYRKTMRKVIGHLRSLENIADTDMPAARSELDALQTLRKEGHQRFRKECD